MEKSFASKPRTSNNTAYTKAAIISSAIRSRIFYMYPECERASATEKPRISRLFCFLYIQPQLFDGLIFIIDFPADGTYGPVIDNKGSVLLFLEHVNNKFAIPRIPTVVQGDLEIETAFTGFRNGRLDRNTLHICKRRPQNMVKNGQFFHIFFYDTVFGKHTSDLIITGLLEHHRRPNLRGQAVEFRFGSHATNSRILLQGTLDLVSNRLHRNTSRAYPRNGCRKIVIPGRNSSVFQLQGESFTNRNSQSVPLMCGDDQEAFGFGRFQLLEIRLCRRTRPAPYRRKFRQQHIPIKSVRFRSQSRPHRNDIRCLAIVRRPELIDSFLVRSPGGVPNFRARGYIRNHGLGGYIPVLKSHRKCHAAPPPLTKRYSPTRQVPSRIRNRRRYKP